MKKKLIFAAAAIAMLASCSQNDLEAPVVGQAQQSDAIEFGTYLGNGATSRVDGGAHGTIISAQVLAQKDGFGVFAYYTGKKTYNETNYNGVAADAKIAPNFMYNQQVTGTDVVTPVWSYSPIKYWPNEIQNGDVDKQTPAAQGSNDNGGKVTFFAYGPYVSTVGTTGITSISGNSVKGDPIIGYKVATAGTDVVDLLWGTKGETGTSVISGGDTGVTGVADDGVAPLTYAEALLTGYSTNADLTKQETDGKVKFAFKHALAKFGGYNGLKVIADVDEVKGTADIDNQTKLTVKTITINASAKNSANTKYYEHQTGNFNLATGVWELTGSEVDASYDKTLYTISGDMLNTVIKDVTGNWDAQPAGVSGSVETNVYASAANETQPILFIPGTRPELEVEIEYVVRTKDTKLANAYTEVTQKIKKTVTFGSAVEINKYYKLVIRLGLTSVKFDATVSDWDAAAGDAQEVNLPLNVN